MREPVGPLTPLMLTVPLRGAPEIASVAWTVMEMALPDMLLVTTRRASVFGVFVARQPGMRGEITWRMAAV